MELLSYANDFNADCRTPRACGISQGGFDGESCFARRCAVTKMEGRRCRDSSHLLTVLDAALGLLRERGEAAERAEVGSARAVFAVPGHYLVLLAGADRRGLPGGAVAASMLVLCLQFLLAIVLRCVWCGRLCPTGGLQELEATAVGKPAKLGQRACVRYVIWVPWMCSIVACVWIAGGTVADVECTQCAACADAALRACCVCAWTACGKRVRIGMFHVKH